MVICPIARAVHCTGCPFVKFCPAKTILGDYGKVEPESVKKAAEQDSQKPEENLGTSSSNSK